MLNTLLGRPMIWYFSPASSSDCRMGTVKVLMNRVRTAFVFRNRALIIA